MNTENLLDYLQRKTVDTSELQAASSIIQQQSRIEQLERENAELRRDACLRD